MAIVSLMVRKYFFAFCSLFVLTLFLVMALTALAQGQRGIPLGGEHAVDRGGTEQNNHQGVIR